MTERVLRAMRRPVFKIWGHPMGRLVSSRPPIPLRIEEVLDALAESRGAIGLARRAGAQRDEVLNTRGSAAFAKAVKPAARERAA